VRKKTRECYLGSEEYDYVTVTYEREGLVLGVFLIQIGL